MLHVHPGRGHPCVSLLLHTQEAHSIDYHGPGLPASMSPLCLVALLSADNLSLYSVADIEEAQLHALMVVPLLTLCWVVTTVGRPVSIQPSKGSKDESNARYVSV